MFDEKWIAHLEKEHNERCSDRDLRKKNKIYEVSKKYAKDCIKCQYICERSNNFQSTLKELKRMGWKIYFPKVRQTRGD